MLTLKYSQSLNFFPHIFFFILYTVCRLLQLKARPHSLIFLINPLNCTQRDRVCEREQGG